MSKSIYEEALDNTQTLLALVNLKELNSKKKLDMLNQIEQALEQAQKQEKLFELYKQLNIIYKKLNTMELSELALNSNYYAIEIIKLKHRIKELEDE